LITDETTTPGIDLARPAGPARALVLGGAKAPAQEAREFIGVHPKQYLKYLIVSFTPLSSARRKYILMVRIMGSMINWQDRISLDPKILVGKPVIKGTRLAVEFVIDLLANGWTQSEILQNYPRLTHEDIQACLCYASSLMKSERIYPNTILPDGLNAASS
jgi:uncharacterized protein (DUF433 family)